MKSIPDIAKKVPLMFRAQVEGRCQLQRLVPGAEEQDIERWASEWTEQAYPEAPQIGSDVQTRSYQINWRFVTNGGQDDGVIRPVIGAKGWPFYPGSSMKGIFRRACTLEQRDRYCGMQLTGGDFTPGILRFHGGYPTSDRWQENLVDLVHPQQDWQVKQDHKQVGAFVQISLHKPKIEFGISSSIPLEDSEWEIIWGIWEKALSLGIGCRVSAGYGQPRKHVGEVLYRTHIKGQGAASKLLDGEGEFRPNIFRAALRGHALRIFGGLTEQQTADRIVEEIFGGVRGEGNVGLIGMTFRDTNLELDYFGAGQWEVPTYEVEGHLSWLLTQSLPDNERRALHALIKSLTQFSMLFGGFGKSWRRADHRLFYPEYYENQNRKPLIGCQWQYEERSLVRDIPVRKLEQIAPFIDKVRDAATTWLNIRGFQTNPNNHAPWREAWHPENVQIWGRLATDAEDSLAIDWLHAPYRQALPTAGIPTGSIYRSSVTGGLGNIGRLWHRMYPVVRLVRNTNDPNSAPIAKKTPQFLEILTIFPDNSANCRQFLEFMKTKETSFQKLWSN